MSRVQIVAKMYDLSIFLLIFLHFYYYYYFYSQLWVLWNKRVTHIHVSDQSFTKVVYFSFGTFFFLILWVIIYLILSNCHSLLSLFLFMGFTFCTIWVPFLLFYLVGIWCRLGHIRFYFSHVKKNLIRIIFASYNHDKIVILFSLCVVNCIFT